LQQTANSYHVNTYKRFPVEFVKGDGVFLYDKNGKEYLDMLCGIAVTGLGHNHKILTDTAKNQIEKLWHVSNLFESSVQENLASKLCKHSGLEKVFFCNSGTEANEAAIKFARKYGNGKSSIITADGGFHGRTMGSLSASAQSKLWEGFHPLTPGFINTPYNDINAIEQSIDENTIAVMVEPIQGENGVVIPSHNYLSKIRDLCSKNHLLMIVDEIQTGLGRTGKMFAYQHNGIIPDIVTLAKGIANGLPLGAVLVNSKVAESITPGCHGSTFGGNPVAVSVAEKVVDLISESDLDRIFNLGELFRSKIINEHIEGIVEIRNIGLMIGIEIIPEIDAKSVASQFLEKGIVVGTAGNNVLRLLPPFSIHEKHIDQFTYILKDLFKNMNISTKAS
jgi:predicted acetylornithine/succinylornithine family transaminase